MKPLVQLLAFVIIMLLLLSFVGIAATTHYLEEYLRNHDNSATMFSATLPTKILLLSSA